MSIEVIAGTFAYPGRTEILTDVSFCVQPGEITAILGPNGVGKTTLLKCMLGFLEWNRGETRLDGKNIKDFRGRSIWQKIAYVPQAKEPVFSFRTEDMVVLGRSPYLGNFRVPGQKDLEIAREAMEMAGISHLYGKNCGQISGGELQLVLIARALASQPEILVLDEPESGLDFRNQIVVLDLLKRLSREKGISVIINTHYPDHALRISDHSLLLFGSGIHFFGRTREILTAEHMKAAFGVEIMIQTQKREGREYVAVIPLELAETPRS